MEAGDRSVLAQISSRVESQLFRMVTALSQSLLLLESSPLLKLLVCPQPVCSSIFGSERLPCGDTLRFRRVAPARREMTHSSWIGECRAAELLLKEFIDGVRGTERLLPFQF